jgi:hypothetical protein
MSDQDGGDVAGVMAKFPGPVTLYADKRTVRFLFVVFAVIELGFVKALFTAESGRLAIWIGLAIFLWGIGSTAFMILNRNALALTLDHDGFTINGMFRPRWSAWKDVGDFATLKSRYFTATTYNDRGPGVSTFQRLTSGYRRLRYGRDTMLPDTYGFDAERLAQLMSLWRQRALASQS